jgi:hypothetical protein
MPALKKEPSSTQKPNIPRHLQIKVCRETSRQIGEIGGSRCQPSGNWQRDLPFVGHGVGADGAGNISSLAAASVPA